MVLASTTDAYIRNGNAPGLMAFGGPVPVIPGPVIPGGGGGGGGGPVINNLITGGIAAGTGSIGDSNDGALTWALSLNTGLVPAAPLGFVDAIYDGAQFAAYFPDIPAFGQPRVYRSADLAVWNMAQLPLGALHFAGSRYLRGLLFSGAYYCYSNRAAQPTAYASADLITWTPGANPIWAAATSVRFLWASEANTLLSALTAASIIRRSADGGNTWNSSAGLVGGFIGLMCGQAVGGPIFLGGNRGGAPEVYVSVDDGLNFVPIVTLNWAGMTALAYLTVTPAGTLIALGFAGGVPGIWRSLNAGIDWVNVTPAAPPILTGLTRVRAGVDAQNSIYVIGTSAAGPTEVLRSRDEAATWVSIYSGFTIQGPAEALRVISFENEHPR